MAPPRGGYYERRIGEVKFEIKNGDALAWRVSSRSPMSSRLIALASRGDHSHIGMAGWWDSDLMCLDVIQGTGGRIVQLEEEVRKAPGAIDVYAANSFNVCPQFDGDLAVYHMRKHAGKPYGWWNLAKASTWYLPLVRCSWLFRQLKGDEEDENHIGDPFCSLAMMRDLALAGAHDIRPNFDNRFATPDDVIGTMFYATYRFTLVP